ncbi:MAG: TlpA family protein disulfide reductase [Prevotellaceae bacterium]|jgi:peroxiredoxin|nr:TlpA family protein disulfide reductase [Prevotellaceae bacterium]
MKKLIPFAFIPLLWACTHSSAGISACIGRPDTRISILQLNATTQLLLDTLRTDALGCFDYTMRFKHDEPAFVLIKTDSAQVATLLLEKGEHVKLTVGTKKQHYTVEGSESARLLQELNSTFQQSVFRFDSLNRVLKEQEGATNYEAIYKQINLELGKVYVKQKRDALRFIYNYPASFASIAALYQKYPTGLPVFAADNDALYFKKLYDTLQPLYPQSEYMVVLRDEYERRMNAMTMQTMMEGVSEIDFPDLELPDINAKKVKLSTLKDKVILVYFWTSTSTAQRMENNDLRRWYDKYAEKGFEIYQVALDTDKPSWAKLVKAQNNPWINVCDGFGAHSQAAKLYNVTTLPSGFLIDKKGQIVAGQLSGKELEKKLATLLN